MPWEYLQTKELDKRFVKVAELVDFKDKHIVDLNGGSCRLRLYIDGFTSYIANDTHPVYAPDDPRIDFYCEDDSTFADRVKQADIVCLFGHGAGDYLASPYESPTLSESLIKIVKKTMPGTVIIEASKKYEDTFGMLEDLKRELFVYTTGVKHEIAGGGEYGDRVMYILRLKA